jgi:transcriptional regulator with XRE-family HTH domain
VRKYRKQAGISQAELAALIGVRSQSVVSDLERGARPSLRVALACEIFFAIPLRDLIPGLYAQIEHDVLRRVRRRAKAAGPDIAPYFAALISRLADSTL